MSRYLDDDIRPDVSAEEELASEVELHERAEAERAERLERRRVYEAAIVAAREKIAADVAERDAQDVANARAMIDGMTFRDGAALFGYLYQHEKQNNNGHALGFSAMARIRRVVAVLWAEIDQARTTDFSLQTTRIA